MKRRSYYIIDGTNNNRVAEWCEGREEVKPYFRRKRAEMPPCEYRDFRENAQVVEEDELLSKIRATKSAAVGKYWT